MEKKKKISFENRLKEYNKSQVHPIVHVNTTFEEVSNAINDILDDRDYEIQDVLSDYLNYCYKDGLIPLSDSWKYMRMQLAGATFEFNMAHNVYYENAEHGFRAHNTLALYRDKSVRAIGKINARITAVLEGKDIQYEIELGDLTAERKKIIMDAMEDGDSHGYDLRNTVHRYFFVEKFHETDFRKTTPRAPMGSRIFNLTELLNTEKIPDAEQLAAILREKTWM